MRRMILPILKKYWKLLLSAMLVSALGCGIMVGMSGAYLSLDRSLNDYVQEDMYPHAFITTEVVNRERGGDIAALPGVTAVNTRICGDTFMTDPNGRYLSVRVFSYDDSLLQKFTRWDEADCGDAETVMLEYNFAVDNGIKAGDKVSFRVDDEYRDYYVEAIVTAPETLSVQITDDSWGINTDFGYAYFSTELLKKEYEKDREKAKQELDDHGVEIDDAEKEANETLDDSLKKLEEAKEKLDEKNKEFQEASKDAREQKQKLLDTERDLKKTRRELEQKIKDLEDARKKLKDAQKQLAESIDKLEQAKSSLAEIDRNLSELNASYDQLNARDVKQLIDKMRSAPADTKLNDIYSAFAVFREFLGVASANGFTYDPNASVSEISQGLLMFVNVVETDYAILNSEGAGQLIQAAAMGMDISGQPGYEQLVQAICRYDDSLLQGGDIVTAYQNALVKNAALHEQIQSGGVIDALMLMTVFGEGATITEMQANLAKLRAMTDTLSEAVGRPINTVGELVSAYDQTTSKLKKSIGELQDQRDSIVSELDKLGIKEKDIDKKLRELKDQLGDAEKQYNEIPDAITKLRDGIKEIEDGLADIPGAIEEIDRQIKEAQEQLNEAYQEYDDGRRKYETSLADAVSEFASLREELQNAYKELDEEEGYDALCNQFLLYFDPNMDQKELLKKCEQVLDDVEIKKSFVYEDSGVKNRIDINLEPIDTMSSFMPMVFFVVILIVVFLFMSLIIRQCRREIGILRALGFTKSSIRTLFCGVELVVSIAAIATGIAIGLGVMRYICGYYQDFFPLPRFTNHLNYRIMALAAVLTVVVGQVATLIGTTLISRIQPSEAMTRPAPVTAKTPRLLAALTKNAKPMVKFSISSMLRNKGRFVFSVICVAASVMMIFSSLAFITSKNRILHELYEQRIRYDCQVFFEEQPDAEMMKEMSDLGFTSNVEPMIYYESEIEFAGKKKDAVVNALVKDTEQVCVFDSDGNRLEIPAEGIMLERHLAEDLGAKAGDTVLVDGKPFRVTEISEQSVSRFQYISKESASGEGTLGCVILDVDEADEQKLLAYLTETDTYLYSVFTRLAYEGNAKVFKTYDLAAYIIIGFAIIIGLTIVYNTTQTNLLERKKELCVLRTLGFQRSEISASLFVQSLLQFLFSCLIGLPAGIMVAKTALKKISTEGREYVFANGPKEYVFTILLVFTYIVISHVLAMNSMKKWDLVENVKEKE